MIEPRDGGTFTSPAFEALAVKLEIAKNDLREQHDVDVYRYFTSFTHPARPNTWRTRLARRWDRVCGYFTTVWCALRGDDPYDSWDD